MSADHILPVHNRMNISFSHGNGVYLYSTEGRKYLDFGAGIAVNVLGHCHPELVTTLQKQAEKLWHVSNIYQIEELNLFADALSARTFADYIFCCNSGAEAVECGIKMIRRHFYATEQANRHRIITFSGAFHGRTIATISAAAKQKYLEGFEPRLPGFDNVEFGNISAVMKAVGKDTAGILIEPIQGEEGIRVADKKFIRELRKIADDHGLLLCFDEVQCGMGRTGYLYAYEYYETIPDIIASAKAIGGGFPLGVCLATKKAASGMQTGTHGTTYGSNPLAMTVGLKVLNIVSEPEFLMQVRKNGESLKYGLEKLHKLFPAIIEEVRGLGLMLGIKINQNYQNTMIVEHLKNNGLLLVSASENVIRILPPLIINKKHIDEALALMTKTFGEITGF